MIEVYFVVEANFRGECLFRSISRYRGRLEFVVEEDFEVIIDLDHKFKFVINADFEGEYDFYHEILVLFEENFEIKIRFDLKI